MASLMETDYAEEEVVENPTLKAAYNLAPLHQNQPLKWNFEVDLIGQKIFDKLLHLCEVCKLPILIYGRLVPCKHIFCFDCARKSEPGCKRCSIKVQKVEELALGTVYVCSHGAPKHSTDGCRRTYLSQRDLQSHVAHRHMSKTPSESSKTSQATPQPQLPLTQQQAAALQHQHPHVPSSSNVVSQSQPNFMTTSVSQHSQQLNLRSSSPFLQASPRDALVQYSHHTSVPGSNNSRTNLTTSHSVSHTSVDPKTSHLNRGLPYNQPLTDQDVYRSIDRSHQVLQQQQSMLQQQRPLLQVLPQQQQQQQRLQMPSMSLSSNMSSTTMPTKSGGVMRFNQPLQNNPVSSPLLSQSQMHSGPRMNQFQTNNNSGSGSDLQLLTPLRQQVPQQNVNLQHRHQVATSALSHRGISGQPQPLMQQSDMADYDHRQQSTNMDNFGKSRQNLDNFNTPQDMDDSDMRTLPNYGSVPQRNRTLFNQPQDLDEFRASQKLDTTFNKLNRGNNFNNTSSGMLPPTNTINQPNPQIGASSRGNNVNLITVPIQDEGQYRPLPFVSQSHGGRSAPNSQFTSNNTNNFTPLNTSSQLRGPRPTNTVRPVMNRMPQSVFNRAPNPRPLHSPSMMDNHHLSQSTNISHPQQPRLTPQLSSKQSPNMMMNNLNPLSVGGNNNNNSATNRMPISGLTQTSNLPHTGSMQFQQGQGAFNAVGGSGQLRMPTNPNPMGQTSHNQTRLMNNPQTKRHWPDEGSLTPIQQRMVQQNLPRSTQQGDNSGFQKRNYY